MHTQGVRAVHAFVAGTVQGVYYRQSCRRVARGLGLLGWVRNTRDGRVEVWAQGADEQVTALVEWMWLGPSAALVSDVVSEDVVVDENLQDFLIVN